MSTDAPKKRGRKPREKQTMIPGTEPETIREVEDAAESYRDVRDERMNLTEQESEAKERLIQVMKKYDLEIYKFDGYEVVRTHDEKDDVKVRKLKTATADE